METIAHRDDGGAAAGARAAAGGRARRLGPAQPVPLARRRGRHRRVAGRRPATSLYRLVRYVFVTGRWEIVRVNLKLFMVGRYPADELWRIAS